jgi:hypothetical protein
MHSIQTFALSSRVRVLRFGLVDGVAPAMLTALCSGTLMFVAVVELVTPALTLCILVLVQCP